MERQKRTVSAGGIVLGDAHMVAIVRHARGGAWTFPKGHVDPGETPEAAARREIKEEAGLEDLEFLGDLGSYARRRLSLDGATEDPHAEMKDIRMFLFSADRHARLCPSMEISEAAWVPYLTAGTNLTNDKDRAWYASVLPRIKEAVRRD